MYILLIAKYPPIQGGVSASCYWLAQALTELGHRVTVLTNADEVEDEYRINLNDEDREYLHGFRIKNSVKVISTKKDPRHHFTPRTNPYLSKLISLGLEAIAEDKPDLIWAHYVEPYGITAMMLSKITGVPYVVRHAGSDLGKLGLTEQLRTIHREVYKQALIVSTIPKHHAYFESIGVPSDKLERCGFRHLPGDLFYADPLKSSSPTVKILVYGKTGSNKGTPQLISAMELLEDEGFLVQLTAHWGGRGLTKTIDQLMKSRAKKVINVQGFIPHWKIPDTIRESDAVVFLENNFSITIHSPGIPLEVLSCGRLLITTEEIAEKTKGLVTTKNSIVIKGQHIEPMAIAEAIKKVQGLASNLDSEAFPDASLVYAQGMKNLEIFLSKVLEKI